MTKSVLSLPLTLILILSPAAPGRGQESAAAVPWPHDSSDLRPDPQLVFGRLDNGLRYMILPNAEPPKRVSLRLHIDAGSLHEADDQQGLAHFLEHMAFNGTTHFAANEMVEFFQRLGMAFGADTNAHTAFNETLYKLELPDNREDLLQQGMLWMRDVADGMIIGATEIDKERGVILSEKRARDNVNFRMMIEGLKFALPDSLVPQRLPIGTEEVIKNVPRQRMVDFYRTWYVPGRMTVIVAGDTTPGIAKKLVASQFTSLKAPALRTPDPDHGKVTTGRGLEAKLLTEMEAGQVKMSIDAARPSRKRPDTSATQRERMIRDLADSMLNRRFEILAKKKDSPFLAAEASNQDWMKFVESAGLEITSRPENWARALSAGEQELRRALEHGFNAAELAEAKANLLNAVENAARQAATRQSRALADAMARSVTEEEVFQHPARVLPWVQAELPIVTAAQCRDALKSDWTTEDIRIFVAGNLTLEDSGEKIKAAWHASRAVPVNPPAEESAATFAYTDFGEPGKVVTQKSVDDHGITQIVFSNGVRLNVKPTDFRKDSIEIAAVFGDGALTLPKGQPGLRLFTMATFEAGGLEKHSIDDLQRILAGRTVTSDFVIGEDRFVLSARTNRSDLNLQFQVLAAMVTAPGWRDDGLARFHMSLPEIYQQIDHTPEGVVRSKVELFTHGGDYRFVFPQQEELRSRTLAEARAWLTPALTASAMEIGVTGDVELPGVIAAVAATFGALPPRAPARQEHEELRNVQFPRDVREKEFNFQSKIPKGHVLVYWPTTDRRRDVLLSRQLALLGSILGDRVRIKVREELGESYSPAVAHMPSEAFNGYGQLMAMMESGTQDAKRMGDIVRTLADGLAARGATADELERARKPLLTNLDQQRRTNAYWLINVVRTSQSEPARLDWARSLLDDVKAVTLDDINRLAKKYLAAGKATIVHVVPTDGNPPAKSAAPKK